MSSQQKYPEEKLLFRRQYILGPRFVDWLPRWQRVEVRNSIRVTAHPDLPVTRVAEGPRSVTLLGYVLDPSDPGATDRDITGRLLEEVARTSTAGTFAEWTYGLGGRWILIVDDGTAVRLFHDPMGMRTVFYTDRSLLPETWCATQPGLIAETLNLARDPGAETEFVNSSVYRDNAEYRWPIDRCVYREVRHLLPNHMLDLVTGVRRRYWPDRPIGRIELAQAVEKVSGLLTAMFRAASARFPLALATTAGWDTRLILAASREVSGRMHFFTRRTKNRSDVTLVPRLLSRLGLPHQLISFPERMDPEFEKIYTRNMTEAHDYWGRMAQGLYESYPQERVCVNADSAEITRNRLRLPAGEAVTPRALARLTSAAIRFRDRLEENPYVVKACEEWLAGVGNLHGVHILDLFYWEQYSGNFSAIAETEDGLVMEFFTPMNCRQLLTTMLAVDESHRHYKRPLLYVEVIKKLWPEVLREPVNMPYEGPLTPLFRAVRSIGLSRLIPQSWKKRVRGVVQRTSRRSSPHADDGIPTPEAPGPHR